MGLRHVQAGARGVLEAAEDGTLLARAFPDTTIVLDHFGNFQALLSAGPEVTLANPFGPPVCGREAVLANGEPVVESHFVWCSSSAFNSAPTR